MRLKQSGPGGCATAPAHESFEQTTSYRRSFARQVRCELHGINLVDEFPPRCPLRALNPLTTIGQLRDLAFESDDPCDAGELRDRADVCGACIDRNLAHRTVKRLRSELGVRR